MPGCINQIMVGSVCQDCWDHRVGVRAALPELWVRLHSRLAKGSQGPSEGLSRPRPGSRPPLQVHVLDTLLAVPLRLAFWANETLAGRGSVGVEGQRPGHVLTAAIHILDSLDESLRWTDEAWDYLVSLGQQHRRMTVLIGLEPTTTRLATPCPSCDQHVVPLWRDAKREVVTCTVCSDVFPDAVWIGRLLAEAARYGQ